MQQQERGILVVLEGIDQSGKSSATKSTCELLNKNNIKCELQQFPDRQTPTGKLINDFLRGVNLPQEVVHLLYSANRWEVAKQIIDKLNKGICVVCDRYAYSGIVYSIANGLNASWCEGPDTGLPKPDVVCYMQLTLEEAEKRRVVIERDRYENVEFQTKVKNAFEDMQKKYGWTIIDASSSKEDVVKQIYTTIEQVIQDKKNQPIEILRFDN
ncbi:Thymidylate kinase [Entamoeba marina]